MTSTLFSSRPPKWARALTLIAGIAVLQAVLYAPSLIGKKILLPLDLLAQPGMWMPATTETAQIQARNWYVSDLVYSCEPFRVLAARELHSGRLATWNPYIFAGTPLAWPKFSPFLVLSYLTESPVILAWVQLSVALVAGIGAYRFFRRGLRLDYWPAVVGAWVYPLTGFIVLWAGSPVFGVPWLPWSLLAVRAAITSKSRFAPFGVIGITALILIGGHVDVAGQVLLVTGFYALWCLWSQLAKKEEMKVVIRKAFLLSFCWALGFLLAAPQLLPFFEYAPTSARFGRRNAGEEERPPDGPAALVQAVLPDVYGTMENGSIYLRSSNQIESAAAAYAGLIGVLVLAPLAWKNRRYSTEKWFWAGAYIVGLSWCANLPPFVHLFRVLPGIKLMSHNRWALASAFAAVTLAAMGLQVLMTTRIKWSRWFYLPSGLLLVLLTYCVVRTMYLPAPLETEIPAAILNGQRVEWMESLNDVWQAKQWFIQNYWKGAGLCAIGLAAWIALRFRPDAQKSLSVILPALLVGEMVLFAFGRYLQSPRELYYPPVPALQQLARLGEGRMIPVNCLPADLGSFLGLREVRGYDGVDPKRIVELVTKTSVAEPMTRTFAQTQLMAPAMDVNADGSVKLHPILDMLSVRYVVGRGEPPTNSQPLLQSPDYWVLENRNALPRAWVPETVRTITVDSNRVAELGSRDFNPRRLALLETNLDLPEQCSGTAKIVEETSTRVVISAEMQTAGLVVLSDSWAPGWKAFVNGGSAPVLRANHAVRGVVVSKGKNLIEYRYEPESLRRGFVCAGGSAAICCVWMSAVIGRRKTSSPNSQASETS